MSGEILAQFFLGQRKFIAEGIQLVPGRLKKILFHRDAHHNLLLIALIVCDRKMLPLG